MDNIMIPFSNPPGQSGKRSKIVIFGHDFLGQVTQLQERISSLDFINLLLKIENKEDLNKEFDAFLEWKIYNGKD